MQRHNDVLQHSKTRILRFDDSLKSFSALCFQRQFSPLVIIVVLVLTTLACNLFQGGGSGSVAIRTHLPTLTRTPLPTLTPTAIAAIAQSNPPQFTDTEALIDETGVAEPTNNNPPSETQNGPDPAAANSVAASAVDDTIANQAKNQPVENPASNQAAEVTANATPGSAATATPTEIPATATPTVIPTDTPTPTPTEPPTPTPLPEGWVFTGIRIYPNQGQGDVLLYGEAINNTSNSLDLFFISGIFFDGGGQPISDIGTVDYWPIETVPAGGRMPFELTIYGSQDVSNVELSVEAGQSEEAPSQNFEFLDVSQSNDGAGYCVSGRVRNPGGQLNHYLSVVAVLYDAQDNVISFSDDYKYAPKNLTGDQTTDFKACANPLGQEVIRHELRAWGL